MKNQRFGGIELEEVAEEVVVVVLHLCWVEVAQEEARTP